MRKVNKNGLDLIKSFEGCELKAYYDSVGVLTIGYGHTEGVKRGQVITQKQADDIFEQDINIFAEGVDELIDNDVSDNEFAAMVSLTFNVGLTNFKRSSLLRLVNAGDFEAAADEFLKWDKAKGKRLAGLTRRRKAERALFLKSEPSEKVVEEPAIQHTGAAVVADSPSQPSLDAQPAQTNEALPPEKIAIEKPEPQYFGTQIRQKITALTGGNLTLQGVRDYAEQAKFLGLSARFWMWVSVIAIVATSVYLATQFYKHWSESKRDLELTNQLIAANSTPQNQVILVDPDKIAAYEALKYKIIRR